MLTEIRKQEKGEVTHGRRPMPILPDTTGRHKNTSWQKHGRVDSVVVEIDGVKTEFVIPYVHLTCYWAMVKFMYMNHSRKVYDDELCFGVEKIMKEEAPAQWNRFLNRETVPARYKGKFFTVRQSPKPWKERLITNLRNICRVGASKNAYGKRLVERGHVMRYETDQTGYGYCTMFLTVTEENTGTRQRGRKRKLIPVI